MKLAKLILVMGKGGVGKTTVARGIASVLAQRGLATVVVELGSAAGARESDDERDPRLAPFASTYLCEADALHEAATQVFGSARIAKLVLGNFAVKQLAGVVPGVREYCLLVAARARLSAFDRVVVDMPATGHGISWLSTARELARLVPHGRARRQAQALDAALRDPDETSYVLVTLPEPMVLSESAELERALVQRLGVHVSHTVLNRVPAESAVHTEELAALERAEPSLAGPLQELRSWTQERAEALRRVRGVLAAGPTSMLAEASARPSLFALQQAFTGSQPGRA